MRDARVAASDATAEPGDLGQRFRIERVLGLGSTAVVLAAHDRRRGVRVALKLLRPELRSHRARAARLVREARAGAQLRSRHATRVLELGRLDDGAPYLVMEYLDGADLACELRTRGPMPARRAAELIYQACDALGEAHRLGVVHRDVKPANLFVLAEPRDRLKVLDFGSCRQQRPAVALDETAAEVAIGTPLYMAPEQLRAARFADPRSDVWSLGAVLYELVSGRPPFRGESVADQCLRATLDRHPPLPGVPAVVRRVISRCLAKSPSDRYPSAAAVADALRGFVSRRRSDAGHGRKNS